MMHDYVIADLRIRSEVDLVAIGLRGFRPFEVESSASDAECTLRINRAISREALGAEETLATSYLAEADAEGCFIRCSKGYIYSVARNEEILFHIDTATGVVETNITLNSNIDIAILRFGLWVMFGVVLSANNAIAIHSSAVVADGRCALFLGESGTGKSTHTRLWVENIDGAKLLNDDSPIIRIIDGEVRVYGSPWSGKTPCYKNESHPIAGLCRLEQAPYNKIHRLPTILAIGAILPSCPPVFAHDVTLQDMICDTVGRLLRTTRAYRLECLPNEDAARLSHKTIFANE
jgi:hypothetical protein